MSDVPGNDGLTELAPRHFSFWWPMTVALAFAIVPAAVYFASLHFTALRFENAEHRRLECAAVTDMAAASLPRYRRVNADRVKAGLPALPIGFNPVLRDVSSDGAAEVLPPYVPPAARFFLVIPGPLDCGRELAQRGLPVMRDFPEGLRQYIRIRFTRIAFSTDGRQAYAERGESCGNTCGYGLETRWRKRNGHWMLDSIKPIWVA